MSKMKFYCIQCNCFPGKFLFCLGVKDEDQIKKACLKFGLWNGEGDFELSDSKTGSCWSFEIHSCIWLRKYRINDIYDQGILAHEITHAVHNHARGIDMKPHESSEEYFCYMQEWLTCSFIYGIKNKKFK